ncbi:hypothetical protein BDR04DRAFT_1127838 [Suillus decipiens]|nr:hypothetical protein BDR04DRAFT_1127838 [Suillus decipiens]
MCIEESCWYSLMKEETTPHPQVHQTQYAKPRTGAALESPKEDIPVAISKLDSSIKDVKEQIKCLVTVQHEELLQQAAGANNLSGSLSLVQRGLDDVNASSEKLRQKIRVPYQTLETSAIRLPCTRQASDALRRISRFVVLSRRLETQMAELAAFDKPGTAENKKKPNNSGGLSADYQDDKKRTIAKAALTITELGALLDGPEETGDALGKDSPESDDRTAPAIDSMIPLRSVKAAAAHIPFIEDAQYKVKHEMKSTIITGLSTLDQSLLASSLQTAYNLRALPTLIQGLSRDLCEAVEERIRTAFDLSSISKEVAPKENVPSSQGLLYKSRVRTEPTNITAPQWTAALWTRLESLIEEMATCCLKVYTLEKVLKLKKDPITQRSFLEDVMKVLENRPRRSLERYARDAAKGSTFLQQTLSSGYPRLLRLFHEFFAKIAQSPEAILALYLSRSTTRLNEAVSQAFAGGSNEGVAIARAVMNGLDFAKLDPLLISLDRSVVTLLGPMATPQQILNGQVATCLYYCWTNLEKVAEEYTESIAALVRPGVKKLRVTYDGIVDPLLTAIRRELASIVSRLHRVDLQKAIDPMAGMAGPSLYIKDLADRLNYVKTQIFTNFRVMRRSPASIARPLGEGGKLQLTTDMTELEFALGGFLGPLNKRGLEVAGEEPLLFPDTTPLANLTRAANLPPLVVLHHILFPSPLPLPHIIRGWQEAEHAALGLVEGALIGKEGEFVELAKGVLRQTRGE